MTGSSGSSPLQINSRASNPVLVLLLAESLRHQAASGFVVLTMAYQIGTQHIGENDQLASFGSGDRFASLIVSMVEPTGSSCDPNRAQNPSRSPPLLDRAPLRSSTDAVGGVNHRVRLAVGEVVMPKSRKVCLMLRLISFRRNSDRAECCCRHRHVFPSPRTWFVAQRAAAEQATNVFLLRLQTARTSAINGWLSVCRSRFSCSRRRASPLLALPLWCRGQTVPLLIHWRFATIEEADDHRLAQARARSSTLRATAGAGGLEKAQ